MDSPAQMDELLLVNRWSLKGTKKHTVRIAKNEDMSGTLLVNKKICEFKRELREVCG